MLLCTLINQIFSVIILHKILNYISLKKYIVEIVCPALILLIMIVSSIYLRHLIFYVNSIYSIMLDFLTSLICSTIVVWIFLNKNEKQFIMQLIVKKK